MPIHVSGKPQTDTFKDSLYTGHCKRYFGSQPIDLDGSTKLNLKPWGYEVFVK